MAKKTTDDDQKVTAEDQRVSLYRRILLTQGKLFRLVAAPLVALFGSGAAQKAIGVAKPRERLVRHGSGPRETPSVKRFLQAAWRMIVASLFYLAPIIGYLIWGSGQSLGEYIADHLALLAMPLMPLVGAASYSWKNHRRSHPPTPPRGSRQKKRPSQPELPRTGQHTRDINDIIANLDHRPLKVAYLAMIAGAIWVAGLEYPLSADTITRTVSSPQDMAQQIRPVLIPLLTPLAVFLTLRLRTAFVIAHRRSEIEECYMIASATLGYREKLPASPSGRQIAETTPWLAIDVKKWWALYEIDRAFVLAPESLSVSKIDAWDEFEANINTKLPRPEEWRVQRDIKGRGAVIGPANYPRQILWDGDYDPDPLTFYLGDNLEDGNRYTVTLNDTSPHAAISGGTSSGKTSGAEIIAAQVLAKPMPWDPTLFGQVHVIDPKGPFAQRWCGRPGVVVSNGHKDSAVEPYVYDDDSGDIVCEKTGVMVMAEHMQHIEDEHKRRADVLSGYPDVATWMALPDEVKREEKFFPILVISDEFLDHTSGQVGSGVRTTMENEAREFIVSLTDWQLRKARNVGIHFMLIAQRANMKLIGDTMMTNMPIRLVTGQIDKPQLQSMFALPAADVPRLPSEYRDPGTGKSKTIPGRARILNALGQPISKIQIMWFGGGKNNETLDKWLPRGNKPLNGDFSLPTGTRPRTKDDFDADGTYVGEMDEAARKAAEAADDDTPVPAPAVVEAPAEPEEPSEEVETGDGPEPAPASKEEASGIFPAATTDNSCDGCEAASSWSCPECDKRYCTEHGDRTRNPDPDAQARFVCGDCAAANPYAAVGLTALLPEVITKSRRYRLHHEYAVREDDAGPYGQLFIRAEEGGKKIVEAYSRPQEGAADSGFVFWARSSSGAVEGLTAVQERVDVAVSTFVRKRQDEGGGDVA